MILTMLLRAWRSSGVLRILLSGGGTSTIDSPPSPPKTCGKPVLETNPRKEENQVSAWSGMKAFTPCRMVESLTCVRGHTNGEVTSEVPISHATIRTATLLTHAPPTASTLRAESHVTRLRRAEPTEEASSWPRVAVRNGITMASRACWAGPSTTALTIGGAMSMPTMTPPTKPTKLSEPTMKPCR